MTSLFSPFTQMADGTLKQVNPLSGTEVWTVPGRGNRPLAEAKAEISGSTCAFCWGRKLETPPEKARMMSDGTILRNVPASELDITDPEFRRIPNLFEIVSFDYWAANYGLEADSHLIDNYMRDSRGYHHVQKIVAAKTHKQLEGAELELSARGFFSGGHDVIVSRDHTRGSGELTQDEHARFIEFTVDAMRDLYERNPHATYVVAFQNWLKPSGASFNHLHKQLVAVDDPGRMLRNLEAQVRDNPRLFQERGLEVARRHNLVIEENDHAVLFAGFGHPYPTVEIYSKHEGRPWEHTEEQIRGMSDILHTAHAALGGTIPSNEEWHHQPADASCALPWRINLKLRVSTPAGFEGGTQIYINTVSPWDLRDKVLEALDNHR